MLFWAFAASATNASGYHGPITDFHAHIRLEMTAAAKKGQAIGSAPIQAADDLAGVTQSALIVIARAGHLDETRAANDAVIAAARASHGRFFAIASVHPADGSEALAELDRLAAAGVKVIKLHPNTQNFDVSDPAVANVVQRCAERGLAILFDSYKPWDLSEMGKFLLLAAKHPDARIVLAHMGLTSFREAHTFSEMHKIGVGSNVYFDLSVIAVLYADSPVEAELVWTIRRIGIDHFLFGSDWPLYTPAEAVTAVHSLGFTDKEERMIFHDNAAAFLEGGDRRSTPAAVGG